MFRISFLDDDGWTRPAGDWWRRCWLWGIWWGVVFLGMRLEAASPGLEIEVVEGRPWLETGERAGMRWKVWASDDLRSWAERAQVDDRLHPYLDSPGFRLKHRYYRAESSVSQPADDWTNQIVAGGMRYFRPGSGGGLAGIGSVKWCLVVRDPDRVYFQDSVVYPYHIQYARARLPGFAGMGAVEFSAQSLYPGAAQRLVLGSVLRAPDPQVREMAIEITGAVAFPAVQAADWVQTVRERLHLPPGWRVFYMPSTEQRDETEAHAPLFASRGIEVASLDRWASTHACYSDGWALGRLVWVPSDEITAALADGRLRLDDILVTDRVPSELPVLAGYLALEPATPNSHVALLARAASLPFAYANGAGLHAEIASLLGRDVLLVVEDSEVGCRMELVDTTDRLTSAERREIMDRKRLAIAIVPKAPRGALTVPVDPLTPADTAFVGGKAAHFGFLRRSLPNDSPHPVIAVTFDLWDAFLAQPMAAGGSLREFIDSRLARHTFPPHIPNLRADLAEIRHAVEQRADFTPAQRTAVAEALQRAGLSGAKIRFRSSTNVEDGDTFNGAGLYDSFSGCLEDDLDGDATGPSHCDPSEPNERGVFRALRKVYASFYNENAVLERLRHQINESHVGMAVLVHFSSPDETEMANGVATFAVDTTSGTRRTSARLVTQLGAESVTNPDPGFRPEVVRASFDGPDPGVAGYSLDEASSLPPAGSPVMTWLDDYRTLLAQLHAAALAYEAAFPEKARYELDFEYKKWLPGHVGLKQIRVVPHPVPVPPPKIP